MEYDILRKLFAEALGTMFLVTAVVGSGIMAERLTDDTALALLANTLPTGAILVVLITILAPISGAHFNPAVTLAFMIRGAISMVEGLGYWVVQIAAGIGGTALAHAMFELPLLQISQSVRTGNGQWIAEGVATFGLVAAILATIRFRKDAVPMVVGLYITSAYWFTASTSFANPAVAIARSFSDTFSGIRPEDVPLFIMSQATGAIVATLTITWLVARPREPS